MPEEPKTKKTKFFLLDCFFFALRRKSKFSFHELFFIIIIPFYLFDQTMLLDAILSPFVKTTATKSVPVLLNVYDITPINGCAYWLGLGVYHSGVEVHGVEYAFGSHDHPTTGIFQVQPKQCPAFAFRKSITIGRTDLSPKEVGAFMGTLADEYTGNSYNLISRNCNHFCNDACLRLIGKPIPRWVNRLAKIGFLCKRFLPVGRIDAKFRRRRRLKNRNRGFEKEKLIRSSSNRFIFCNFYRNSSEASWRKGRSRRRKRHLPSLVMVSSSSILEL